MAFARGEYDKRRVPPGTPRKAWEVKELWDLHKEISRRIFLGQKNVVIAEALGCTAQFVCMVRNSPVVKEHTEMMQGAADANCLDVAQRIQEMAPKALNVLEEILDTKNNPSISPALRFRAAESILDRSGNSKIIKSQNLNMNMGKDDLEAIKERALKKAKEAGITVVTSTDSPSSSTLNKTTERD